MKIKLKDQNVKLPNIWKSCGVSFKDWDKLHNGSEIEVKEVPESIEYLLDVSGKKKKGDK